jgi:hypothetical protein
MENPAAMAKGLPFVEKGLTAELDWNSLRWNYRRIVPSLEWNLKNRGIGLLIPECL